MKQASYTVILRTEPEGGYTATVPSLPGCVTYGKDVKEAKKMATEAIRAYIRSLEKHKELVPKEESIFVTNVNVSSTGFSFA